MNVYCIILRYISWFEKKSKSNFLHKINKINYFNLNNIEEEKTKKSENQIETKINNTNNQTKTLENYQLKTTLKFHSNSYTI